MPSESLAVLVKFTVRSLLLEVNEAVGATFATATTSCCTVSVAVPLSVTVSLTV